MAADVMESQERSEPVQDSVPKVDNAVAIGEDLAFQRRWWRFERFAWSVFALVLVADALGCFGRGWLSKAERQSPDKTIDVKYERVARADTPSVMTVRFGDGAVRDGAVRLFVSDSLVQELGAQRIIPQPERSEVGKGGVTYLFPVSSGKIAVQIALEPSFPGVRTFRMGVPGGSELQGRIVVMP